MIRIKEDADHLRKRMETDGRPIKAENEPVAILLDLRKAYPRVNRPFLWGLLQRYGIRERALRVLKDLHVQN